MGVRLTALRLSRANDEIVDSEQGISLPEYEGKRMANVSEDGRHYIMVEFRDADNPFAPKRTRLHMQSQSGEGDNAVNIWKSSSPKELEKYVGKVIPGVSIKTVATKPYLVGDNEVSSFTTVLFDHENINTILKSNNIQPLDITEQRITVKQMVDEE